MIKLFNYRWNGGDDNKIINIILRPHDKFFKAEVLFYVPN